MLRFSMGSSNRGGHTDGADDAGTAELARRLELGVEVGEPFGAGLAKGLVVQRAGHCGFVCTVVRLFS
jgi:hypothetical protein